MKFLVENVATGKKEQVNEEQWKKIQSLFPGMFKRSAKVESYSDEAKKVIAEAESKE